MLKYYWGRMHQYIHDYIQSCGRCRGIKMMNVNHKAPLSPMLTVESLDRIHIDILDLTQTKEG